MPSFADTSGQPIRVGARLGAGGEGSVHEIDGRPDTVAKIYHKPFTSERAQKIVAMASLSSPALQRATAWPSGILMADGRTPRRRLDEHKNVLIRELDHRFKNVLAVISAIASRTQETTGSMAAFATALKGRIEALTMAHELLSRRKWHGISLVDLVHRELAPYATASNTEIKGSDDILSADAGQVIGMVLHELATNAAKYGALSNKDGCVLVCWRQQQNGQGENKLRIEWQERGGPWWTHSPGAATALA
jgi:two-component sensor histidine kinase